METLTATETEFIFNNCGVCTNPIIVFQSGDYKIGEIEIRIARNGDQWSFGYSTTFRNCGTGCAPSQDAIWTKDEAIEQAIFFIDKEINHYLKENPEMLCFKIYNNWKASRTQLSLF